MTTSTLGGALAKLPLFEKTNVDPDHFGLADLLPHAGSHSRMPGQLLHSLPYTTRHLQEAVKAAQDAEFLDTVLDGKADIGRAVIPDVKRRCHRGSVHTDLSRDLWRPISTKQRHAILEDAERYEIRTKQKGRESGALGYIGLRVLRAMMKFQNRASGALYPTYTAIQRATGLCRQSVSDALSRLEAAGYLTIIRRFHFKPQEVVNAITGKAQVMIRYVQSSNAYRVVMPLKHEPDQHWVRPAIGRTFPKPWAPAITHWVAAGQVLKVITEAGLAEEVVSSVRRTFEITGLVERTGDLLAKLGPLSPFKNKAPSMT